MIDQTANTALEAQIRLISESIDRTQVKLEREQRRLRELTLKHI